MKTAKILVVEDDEVDFMGLNRELRKHDLNVEIIRAIDGVSALQLLRECEEEPLLVLLDLNLPRMSGLECLREIRSHSSLRELPVMVLTTSRNKSDLEVAYGLGVAGYLVKDGVGAGYSEAVRLIMSYCDAAGSRERT